MTLGANLARLHGDTGDSTGRPTTRQPETEGQAAMNLNLMMTDDQELRPRITVFGVGGAASTEPAPATGETR